MLLLASGAGAQSPPLLVEGETFSDLETLLTEISWTSAVHSVSWHGDDTLVTGSGDGAVRLWDLTTGRERWRLWDHRGDRDVLPVEVGPSVGMEPFGSAQSVVLSADGTRLAVAYENDVVRLWDLRQGGEVLRLTGRSVACSVDGRWLATGSKSGTVRILDVDDGPDAVSTLDGHSRDISAVAWSVDGRLASSSWDNTLLVRDVADGSRILFDAHTEAINDVAWSPGGERIASVSSDGTARVWEAETGAEIYRVEIGSPLLAVAWSVDGHTVAIGSADGSLGLWDLAHDVGVELGQLAGHRGAVYDLAFSPQGDRLASGSADGTAKVWDIASGREVLQLRGPASQPSALGLSRDGRFLVVGYEDDRVRIWSLGAGGAPGRAPEALPPGDGQGLVSIAVNVGPTTVVAAGFRDGRVAVWEDGRIRNAALRHDSSVSFLAFHPDGKKLASGTERGLIRVWDLESSVVRRVWDPESGEVRSRMERSRLTALAWGPGGLVTGDRQREVRLWDPEDDKPTLVTRLDMPSREEVREVWGLAFPVTGEVWILLRSGGMYRWSPATGTLAEVVLLPDALSSVALSGDGRFLAAVKASERRVRVLRRDGQSFSLAHQLVGGADKRWMACNAGGRCWRHDDGTLLLRPGPLGELTSVPPAVSARSSLTLESPLPAQLDVDGDDGASFAITVRNHGPEPIYWLRVRQRTPGGAFLRIQSPATLAVLRPGAVAQLECRLSGMTEFETPQQRTTSLELELLSAHGPLQTLAPIEVVVHPPSLRWEGVRLFRRSLEATLTNTGRLGLPPMRLTARWASRHEATSLRRVEALPAGETLTVSFALPEEIDLKTATGVWVVAETLRPPLHQWSSEQEQVGGWSWRRGRLFAAGFLLAAALALARRLAAPKRSGGDDVLLG